MLADDFFRLAHDDVTGRLRLSHRTISVGLAAALLGELLALRRIQIVASGDVRIIDRTPPEDAVAHMVLERLVLEPRSRSLLVWVDRVAQSAYVDVAGRLMRAGQLRVQVSRRLIGRVVTLFLPTDMNQAARPMALLSTQLRWRDPLNQHDSHLAGLVLTTGLDRYVLDGAPAVARGYLRFVVEHLPPPMPQLLHAARVHL